MFGWDISLSVVISTLAVHLGNIIADLHKLAHRCSSTCTSHLLNKSCQTDDICEVKSKLYEVKVSTKSSKHVCQKSFSTFYPLQ